jgi:2-hydroxycyclohexanecarboxyl-CoA dehydrogenase
VTGGGRGIGEGICRRLAAEGAHVIVASRTLSHAEKLAAEIGGEAVAVDVGDIEAAHAVVSAAGKLDILVNNAGIDDFDFFTKTTPERWRRLIAVNLEGVLACTHAALPPMQQARYGRIVTVGSEAGRIGSNGNAVYAATKAALVAFMKSIARENAKFGITANTVISGPVETPMLEKNRQIPKVGEKIVEAMAAGTLLGRLGTIDEIGAAVAFLASDDASFITAESLGVSGGMGIST